MLRGALILLTASVLAGPAQAREFNSKLKLKVYERGTGDAPDRVLGFTPASPKHRIVLPEGGLWYIQPLGSLSRSQLERLGQEIRAAGIPGLDLSDHWEISDGQLAAFGDLPSLRMLVVSRTRIGDRGIPYIAKWTALETLALGESVSDEGVVMMRPLQRLRDLSLDRVRMTDASLDAILALKKIDHLDLSSTGISAKGIARLAALPRLEHLIVNGAVTDESAEALSKFGALQELDVTQTEMAGKGYAQLAALPKLHSLYASRSTTDVGLQAIAKVKRLRTLDVSGATITDKGVLALTELPQLRALALTDTPVTDAGVAPLAAMPQLQVLELSQTQVTSRGLLVLGKARSLRTLSLSWEKLEKRDVENLAHLTQLQTILLSGVPLPSNVMAEMRELAQAPPAVSVWAGRKALSAPIEPAAPVVQAKIAPLPGSTSRPAVPIASPPTLRDVGPAPNTAAASAWIPSRTPVKTVKPVAAPPAKVESPSMIGLAPAPVAKPKSAPPAATASRGLLDKSVRAPISTRAPGATKDLALEAGAPPSANLAKQPSASADTILQQIMLHSKTMPRAATPRVSSLRQMRHTADTNALSDIIPGSRQDISMPEDKQENYLGDLSVEAAR